MQSDGKAHLALRARLAKKICGMIANETTIHKRPKWHKH